MYQNKLKKILNLIEKENYKKALILFKRLIKDFPSEDNIKMIYIDALYKKQKYKDLLSIVNTYFKDSEKEDVLKISSLALLEMQDYLKALNFLTRLVKFYPHPLSFNYLAICYAKLNQEEKAYNSFQKALNLDNQNALIYINFANFLRENNRTAEAIKVLKEFHERIENINILILLSGILRDIRDHNEALKYCGEAIKLDGENPNLLLIFAVIKLEMGEKKESIKILNRAIQLKPFFGPAYRLLSLLQFKIEEDVLNELEKYLSSPNNEEINSIHLGLALSGFLEQKQKYKKSFIYLKKYNSLYRKLIKYNQNELVEKFQNVKNIYNSIKNYKESNSLNEQEICPIFVLGMPRSSTSLVEQIISSHSKIFGCGELVFLEEELSNLFNQKIDSKRIDLVKRNYFSKTGIFDKSFNFFTDKNPLNFFYIGLIPILFDKSRIILCERNRMDNLYSIYRNFFPSRIDFSYDLEELKFFENLYIEILEFWDKEKIDYYKIKYEELVSDFNKGVDGLFNYIGLPSEDSCYNFHRNKRVVQTASLVQVREPLFKTSMDVWKNYEKELNLIK